MDLMEQLMAEEMAKYQAYHEERLAAQAPGKGWMNGEAVKARHADPERQAVHAAVVRYANGALHASERFVFIARADQIIFNDDVPDWKERLAKVLAWDEENSW